MKMNFREFYNIYFENNVFEYLELAKNPEENREILQNMVKSRAVKAGYNIELFHGSRKNNLTVFDPRHVPPKDRTDGGRYGWDATYLSSDKEASGYGKNLYKLYVKMTNPFIIPAGSSFYKELEKRFLGVTKKVLQGDNFAGDYIQRLGFDGVLEENAQYVSPAGTSRAIYAVYNPNQIKSADSITYDDNGEIIPLYARFNRTKDDIRY